MANLNTWFQKHDLCAGNILYIYRNDHKTVICRTDGEEFSLFAPVHDVLSVLPEGEFLNISKGTVVCRSHIVNISHDGVYTMSDGRTFQGRKRGLSSHRRLRTEIGLTDTQPLPLNMLEKCTLLDDMPLAFCVIELTFNEEGSRRGFRFSLLQCRNGKRGRRSRGRNAEPLVLRSLPQWRQKMARGICRRGAERYKTHPPRLQPGDRQISYHPLLSARTRLLCLCAASDRERNRIKSGIIPDYPPWCSVCIFPRAARFFQFLSSALIPANFRALCPWILPFHPHHPPSPPQELHPSSCGVLLCSIFTSYAI